MLLFWSLVLLLMQKPFTALLQEGERLQSPGTLTDPDGITGAGTI